MNRRKAIGGILGITGISMVTFSGMYIIKSNLKVARGQLYSYVDLIAELADTIIPPTDTPGAKDANVQTYIIEFMESCAPSREYANFFNGLLAVEETCSKSYHINYESCTPEQKIKILKDLDNNGHPNSLWTKVDNKLRGRSFFAILKSLTIEAYCTSEQGATQLLAYAPVPARYKAITTLAPHQKAWATK